MEYPRLALLIATALLVKIADLPALLCHFSCPAHDYNLYRPIYTRIPRPLFYPLCIIADILTAYKIRSANYLIYSAFAPLDISAIENCLLVYDSPLSSPLLQLLDPVYFVSSKEPFLTTSVHHFNHIPSLNGFWYHHMCIFQQFGRYTADIILLCAHILVSKDARLLPIFRNCSAFRNYLLFICDSQYITLYLAIYACFVYLCHLLNLYNVVNTNFMFWASSIFIGLYVFDIRSGLGHGACKARGE